MVENSIATTGRDKLVFLLFSHTIRMDSQILGLLDNQCHFYQKDCLQNNNDSTTCFLKGRLHEVLGGVERRPGKWKGGSILVGPLS
jgi:hypothetical protein